jgi:hypothetical protein
MAWIQTLSRFVLQFRNKCRWLLINYLEKTNNFFLFIFIIDRFFLTFYVSQLFHNAANFKCKSCSKISYFTAFSLENHHLLRHQSQSTHVNINNFSHWRLTMIGVCWTTRRQQTCLESCPRAFWEYITPQLRSRAGRRLPLQLEPLS